MLAFMLRRLGQAVLVMLKTEPIAFALLRFVVEPVASMQGEDATPAQRRTMRVTLGMDQPFSMQYARYVARAQSLLQAVTFADAPVTAAYRRLIGRFFAVIHPAVDLLYYAVDPRPRADRAVAAHRENP